MNRILVRAIVAGAVCAASQLLKAYRLRYTIGYSPTGVASGGWHALKVSVSRRGTTVKARDGYQGG